MTVPSRPLRPREMDILRLLAQGLKRPEIAAELHLGVATVATYASGLYERLDARTAAQAVSRAYEVGLLRVGNGVCCRRAVEGAVAHWLRAEADRLAAAEPAAGQPS